LSMMRFTSSVGMSFQVLDWCQQLQNEHRKLHLRVSLREQYTGYIDSPALQFFTRYPITRMYFDTGMERMDKYEWGFTDDIILVLLHEPRVTAR